MSNNLINTIQSEIKKWETKRDEQSKLLFDDDGYEDDWGEGNEWLGYCGGRVEALKFVLEEITGLNTFNKLTGDE